MNPFRKRLLLTLLLLCGLTAASAQHHFDAQAFEAEKQTYIVQQAHLTPEETRRFVPLYKEMVAKKRKIHGQLRQLRKQSADNDRAARALIERRDNLRDQHATGGARLPPADAEGDECGEAQGRPRRRAQSFTA